MAVTGLQDAAVGCSWEKEGECRAYTVSVDMAFVSKKKPPVILRSSQRPETAHSAASHSFPSHVFRISYRLLIQFRIPNCASCGGGGCQHLEVVPVTSAPEIEVESDVLPQQGNTRPPVLSLVGAVIRLALIFGLDRRLVASLASATGPSKVTSRLTLTGRDSPQLRNAAVEHAELASPWFVFPKCRRFVLFLCWACCPGQFLRNWTS
jgi:hypothetical protein